MLKGGIIVKRGPRDRRVIGGNECVINQIIMSVMSGALKQGMNSPEKIGAGPGHATSWFRRSDSIVAPVLVAGRKWQVSARLVEHAQRLFDEVRGMWEEEVQCSSQAPMERQRTRLQQHAQSVPCVGRFTKKPHIGGPLPSAREMPFHEFGSIAATGVRPQLLHFSQMPSGSPVRPIQHGLRCGKNGAPGSPSASIAHEGLRHGDAPSAGDRSKCQDLIFIGDVVR